MDAIVNFLQQTGFYIVQQNPLSLVMLVEIGRAHV